MNIQLKSIPTSGFVSFFLTHTLQNTTAHPHTFTSTYLLAFVQNVSLSVDTNETSGWCHVIQLLFEDWHQWRENISFFPEYDPKFLATVWTSCFTFSILNTLFPQYKNTPSQLRCSNYAKFRSICDYKMALNGRSHSHWTRIAPQQWRPDKNCCDCKAPTLLLPFKWGPQQNTLQEKPSSLLMPFVFKPTTAISSTDASKSCGTSIKLSVFFLAQSWANNRKHGNQGRNSAAGQCHARPNF